MDLSLISNSCPIRNLRKERRADDIDDTRGCLKLHSEGVWDGHIDNIRLMLEMPVTLADCTSEADLEA